MGSGLESGFGLIVVLLSDGATALIAVTMSTWRRDGALGKGMVHCLHAQYMHFVHAQQIHCNRRAGVVAA